MVYDIPRTQALGFVVTTCFRKFHARNILDILFFIFFCTNRKIWNLKKNLLFAKIWIYFRLETNLFCLRKKSFVTFNWETSIEIFFFRLKDCAIHNQRPFLAIKHNSRMTIHLLQPPPSLFQRR